MFRISSYSVGFGMLGHLSSSVYLLMCWVTEQATLANSY